MTTTTTTALSPQAHEVGGALVLIFSNQEEVARYSRGDLTRIEQRAIGNLVADFPRLNTEANVGALIWLTSFHGTKPGDINQLFEEYLEDDIYLVFEYLVEVGKRTIKSSAFVDENENTFGMVIDLLDFLRIHREVVTEDKRVASSEALDSLVVDLGGLEAIASYHTAELLQEALDHPKE